jgi:aspartate aminotransferase
MMSERFKPFRFSPAGLRGLKASPTLSMNERVRDLRAAGRDVYQLGFGESRFPVHPKVAAALGANADKHSYLPAAGLPELRETVAAFYRRHFQMDVVPDQVVVGPGSKALLYALLLALGEEVILPRPAWVSYAAQARVLGKPVLWIPLDAASGYQLDMDALRRDMDEDQEEWGNPEVLVINSPHNPTGTMLQPETLRNLAEFCRESDLMVVSDEIYALTAYGIVPHVSIGQYYAEGTIVLGGLSKHLSLGGWRLGVAILPPGRAGQALRRAVQTIAGSVWSCVTAPVQYAALVAYSGDPEIETFVSLCTQMHALRTQHLHGELIAAGIPCPPPAGAFYLYPSFNRWQTALAARGIRSSEDLVLYLLDRYELATLPASAFGCPPDDLSLRLSSSYLDADTDEQASHLVEAFRADPDPGRFIENHHPRLREAAARLAAFCADLERG